MNLSLKKKASPKKVTLNYEERRDRVMIKMIKEDAYEEGYKDAMKKAIDKIDKRLYPLKGMLEEHEDKLGCISKPCNACREIRFAIKELEKLKEKLDG